MTNADRPDPTRPAGSASPAPGPATAGMPNPGVPGAPAPAGAGDGSSDGPGNADRGREVAGHARSEAEQVAETASDRAGDVLETAQHEVHDVVDEVRGAVRDQADRQAAVAADALGRVRDDLQAMSSDEAPRTATAEYLQQAAGSLDDLVDRLERDGVEGALSGIRRFARRSPSGFLFASAGAGFAIGRILRNADHPQQVDEDDGARGDHEARSGAGREAEIDLTDQGPTAPGPQVEQPLVGREGRR